MRFSEDPARITKGMDECDPRDELIVAVADNVVADPEGVHLVSTTGGTFDGVVGNLGIEVTFNNTVGQTARVDGILETLSMGDWRVFCDKFLAKMLESIGCSADAYDWPTPHPEVTKTTEEDDTDVIAAVRVKWSLDGKTWLAAKTFVEDRARRIAERGEETCPNCGVQIKYKVKKGRNVVTCPECGEVTPLCDECDSPERRENACRSCRVLRMCRKMNGLMAEWRRGK